MPVTKFDIGDTVYYFSEYKLFSFEIKMGVVRAVTKRMIDSSIEYSYEVVEVNNDYTDRPDCLFASLSQIKNFALNSIEEKKDKLVNDAMEEYLKAKIIIEESAKTVGG